VTLIETALPPATGAWREGDPPGRRQWVRLAEPLPLEFGGELPGVSIAYETWGTLAPDRSNAVLVLHALTGDSHAAGPAGPGHRQAGWWDGMIGPGAPIDTEAWRRLLDEAKTHSADARKKLDREFWTVADRDLFGGTTLTSSSASWPGMPPSIVRTRASVGGTMGNPSVQPRP